MSETDPEEEITRLLRASQDGDLAAKDKIIESLYRELRSIAHHLMRAERPGHTLQPTALVHELLLRIRKNQEPVLAENKSHFIFMATRAMRNLLVDHARGRRREKRGGDLDVVPIQPELHGVSYTAENLLAIHEALDKLQTRNVRQSQVAEMRIFGGFELQEIAETLGVTRRTIDRDWQLVKAWLHVQLGKNLAAKHAAKG